jgi:hypothetical protein
MVMKIIRHSQKVLIYSLSIFVSAQHTLCMDQNPDHAAHPDQRSTNQLTTMLEQHDNVDQLIDTIQQAIGGVHEDDATTQYFTLHLPERGNQSLKGKVYSARQLEGVLCEIQTQRQTYDASFWFKWQQFWNKRYNKRVIRNNFKATIADAYNRRCKGFNPTIIQNLPKSANDIVPLNFIRYLQKEFGSIPSNTRGNLRCLDLQKGYSVLNASTDEPAHYTSTIEQTLAKLHIMHDFFDNPPYCLSLCGKSATENEYRIFLRTHINSHNSLIARLKCLSALTLPKQISIPPTQQQPPSTQPHSPYIVIIGGNTQDQPPSFSEGSYPPSQFADPFIPQILKPVNPDDDKRG